MLCALIMAGGKGERFWPLSTDEKPKQFLKLLGEETMIHMTVKRIEKLIPIERIFVVTAEIYTDLVKEQLPNLPQENIIIEPIGKNTAPCIGLSAFIIEKKYKDSSIIVVPSDHLIVDEEKFREIIKTSYNFIQDKEDAIVTLGMKPDRPETGYGYIQYVEDKEQSEVNGLNVFKVMRFVEKPNLQKAQEYIRVGNFLWNGGMFIWKCSTVIKLMKEYLNNTYKVLSEIAATSEGDFNKVLAKKYCEVENVSVDYGIMEKAENIYVIPSDFGWDDIGTWRAVERYREKDDNNNVYVGDIKNIEGHNNIVMGKEKPIVVVGLEDIFVVESDEIIFVGKKKDIERIKELKKKICVH